MYSVPALQDFVLTQFLRLGKQAFLRGSGLLELVFARVWFEAETTNFKVEIAV